MAKNEPKPKEVICQTCNGVGTVLGMPDSKTGKAEREKCPAGCNNGRVTIMTI